MLCLADKMIFLDITCDMSLLTESWQGFEVLPILDQASYLNPNAKCPMQDVFANLGLPGGLQASLVKAGLSGSADWLNHVPFIHSQISVSTKGELILPRLRQGQHSLPVQCQWEPLCLGECYQHFSTGVYSIMRSLGLEPGGEFKAGIEEADKIGKAFCLLPCISERKRKGQC